MWLEYTYTSPVYAFCPRPHPSRRRGNLSNPFPTLPLFPFCHLSTLSRLGYCDTVYLVFKGEIVTSKAMAGCCCRGDRRIKVDLVDVDCLKGSIRGIEGIECMRLVLMDHKLFDLLFEPDSPDYPTAVGGLREQCGPASVAESDPGVKRCCIG